MIHDFNSDQLFIRMRFLIAEESVRKDYIKCLVEGEIIRCLRRPLMETTSSSVQHIAAQLLAEIAKTGDG